MWGYELTLARVSDNHNKDEDVRRSSRDLEKSNDMAYGLCWIGLCREMRRREVGRNEGEGGGGMRKDGTVGGIREGGEEGNRRSD
ncbi:hypothetical protein Tco_0800454 [Tanacetum coccineum]|uniref:Uncharacterized protein n=1 Tax=Tanacetum coccineum TaxID=301880 RepID=A0ABQ4ZW46_9ASTR